PRGAPRAARAAGADLLHGAGFRVAPVDQPAVAVTLHDETPWDDPPTSSLWTRVSLRRSVTRALPHLRGALTTTEAAAAALEGRLPALRGRLHVAPLGVDHAVFRPDPPGRE